MSNNDEGGQMDLFADTEAGDGEDEKGARRPEPDEVVPSPELISRVRGGMLGLACGDALGAPIEFKSLATVRNLYGTVTDMIGGGMWGPGEWTDDTGMALAIAEAIVDNPDDPVPGAGERFLTWSKTAKDVGGTISAALSRYRQVGKWAEASSGTHQAKSGRAAGNGSLMRTLPVALAYPEMRTMLVASARLSAMTHWDPQAEVCCAIYNLWIDQLLAGAERYAGWREALRLGQEYAEGGALAIDSVGPDPLPEELWARFENVTDLAYTDLQPSGYAGYSVECLEAAAWCALFASDAEQAITDVVNLAGESDTMGAVAGGAVGVYWGEEALPSRWLERLHQRERIEQVSEHLAQVRNL